MLYSGTISGGLFLQTLLQLAPTTTAHDPNPPITLESVTGGLAISVSDSSTVTESVQFNFNPAPAQALLINVRQ